MNNLLFLTAFPLAAGMAMLAVPDRLKTAVKAAAVGAAAAAVVMAFRVFLTRPVVWQAQGVRIFRADNLSAFIGLAVSVCALLVIVYACGFVARSYGRYFGLSLLTLGAAFGVSYANHLLALLIAWGFLAVMLFLMVNLAGTPAASAAARKALVIVGGTDAVLMFGIGLIWAGTGSFLMDGARIQMQGALAIVAYLSLAAAAFAKAGAMPFHAWLPDVAEAGPAPVSAYLPAALDKLLGIYLLARLSLDVFVMSSAANRFLLIIGSCTIIVAVVMALTQHSMKRLLGYHAVSQVGYMVLGIGTGSVIGIAGSLFHMVNNAIYKSCLFMTAGVVEKRLGTVDLSRLGGLWRVMPVAFWTCLIAALSISGVPPFNGFVSKWMIYQGIIQTARPGDGWWVLWLVAAMFGSALTVASFMKLVHAVFLGRPAGDWKDVRDAGALMGAPMAVLAALCVVFGVFAMTIPLAVFIAPIFASGIAFTGTWTPVAATALIIIGVAAGAGVYLLFRTFRFRTTGTFVGGEEPEELERVSGAEFYETISDLGVVKRLCGSERSGDFDVFLLGKRAVYAALRPLKALHNGILPSYLVWCLLGLAVACAAFMFR